MEYTIQNVWKRAGLATRPRGMSDSAIEHAVELEAFGLSVRRVAKEIGFDPKTVAKELRLRGIAM